MYEQVGVVLEDEDKNDFERRLVVQCHRKVVVFDNNDDD